MQRRKLAIFVGAIIMATNSLTTPIHGQPVDPDKSTKPAVAAPADAKHAVDVPVKVVVLFSSGVGYFEHAGLIQGTSTAELRFKTNQINDILKSLVLEDANGGKVTAVTYPSQDPISKTLRSFQIDITSNPSLGEMLNQLRGAKVKVNAGVDNVDGTILGLEKKKKPAGGDKGIVESWTLNLITGGTIRSIDLDSVSKLELEDKQLQEELGKALTALAQARDQDKKPVTINFTGDGQRNVRLGYVVETPIWKTSYRLILSDDAKGKPKDKSALQGWAIVENQTDNDWNNVQMSLVSGRPISFIQDLYQPLYVPRPTVKPELFASLRPQTYDGGMEEKKEAQVFQRQLQSAQLMDAAKDAAPMAKRKSMAEKGEARAQFGGGAGGAGGAVLSDAPAEPMDPTASIASVASAAKIGELFQYTVGNVSLPRQRSAMIPIITDPVELERLSIYNQSVLQKNPLNGARLKNTTGKHLLAGPITVLDGSSYAGDASIDNVPPGQERLISYGIDLQLLVDPTKNSQSSRIQSGKIIKGVLLITNKNVAIQEYRADNKGDKDKTLVIEHPIRQGWKLVDTDKPLETTEMLYRFKGQVPAGKATVLKVTEEVIESQEFAILPNSDVGSFDWYSKQGEISKAVREALIKVMQMKYAIVDVERKINDHDVQVNNITQEQNRLRENMKTVNAQSEYYTRLMKKLNDQETSIEKLQSEKEELQKTLVSRHNELEKYLTDLNVE